ncbi:MAG: hypothetical protein HPY55_04945 [Firmicutes bacterium]|nr:hypothetical protein [Bacillota bacterium]
MISVMDLVEIVAGAVAGALACTWTAGLMGAPLLRNLLVFLSILVAGDISRATLGRRDTYYLEDLLNNAILYAILAITATAVTWLARRYLGTDVEPLFPGVGAHIFMTLMPARERKHEPAGGASGGIRRG